MTNIEVWKTPDQQPLAEFQKYLNKKSTKKEQKTSPSSGNAKYIPIGIIEAKLDEVYGGIWKTTGKVEIMLNSIVATVTLSVFHPVAKIWVHRVGVGAKKIQADKGAISMDATKIKADAFEKGAPAAKSMALRNAASSLGEMFGRSLNRDMDDYLYEPLTEQLAEFNERLGSALEYLSTSSLPAATKTMLEKRIDQADAKGLLEIINYLKTKQ